MSKEEVKQIMQTWMTTPQVAVSPAKMNSQTLRTLTLKMKKQPIGHFIMPQEQQVFAEVITPYIPYKVSLQLESKDHTAKKWKTGLLQTTC
jgi:hypothetical protein